jgi:predicted ATPase
MIERLACGKELPFEAIEQILAKADGVPLFLEELTKAVLELNLVRDAGEHYELRRPHPPLALPATLHDSLMARLDRLGSAKLVAQVAAAIGRDFGHDILAAVTGMDEEELAGALSQLVVSEIVSPHGSAPTVTYSFKHQLMCDAAYGSLLRGRRRKLHARIAAAIAARFPRIAVAEPESVARHLAEAGFPGRAVEYWKRAGEVARQRGAYRELLEHARRGLALLGGVPRSTDRSQEELVLDIRSSQTIRRARA